MPFALTIAAGDRRGERFVFDGDEVVLGRAAGSDLVLDDDSVSRTHARIRVRRGVYVLCDGGSTNGTELNGVRLDGRATLRDGDRIGVGTTAFAFAACQVRNPPPVQARALWRARRVSARLLGTAACALLAAGLSAALLARNLGGASGSSEPRCPEAIALDEDTASLVFGRGAVDVDCGPTVAFGFTVPDKRRVRFRGVARDIAGADEVELKLNGKHLAWAPIAGAGGAVLSLPLPDGLLDPGGRNVLSATASRPGKDWALSGIAIEVSARSNGDLKAGREAYERGRRKLDERRVAPRNLFDAWVAFGEAARLVDDLDPRPALYAEAAALEEDARRHLARDCARLLFSAERHGTYRQDAKARLVYREVLLRFPGDDPSGCRRRAKESIVALAPEDEG